MADEIKVVYGIPLPPVKGRGRKAGVGTNIQLLKSMGVGGSLIDIPRGKVDSLVNTAFRIGIKVSIRKLEHNGLYLLQRTA